MRRSRSTTASGLGWHRYNGDGYGDRGSDGRPWAPSGQGTGHVWPVLSAERAEQALVTGDATSRGLATRRDGRVRLRRRADPRAGLGRCPISRPRRSAPTRRSPRSASRTGRCRLRLAVDLVGGLVRPARRRPRGQAQRGPARRHARALRRARAGHDDADRDEPGRRLVGRRLAGHGHAARRQPATRSTSRRRTPTRTRPRPSPPRPPPPTAPSASMSWSPAARASSTSSPSAQPGGTAHAKRTILFDFVPGTLIFDVTDPDNDDNGPGNYAYPTVGRLQGGRLRHPGVPGLRRRLERDLPAARRVT